jgi:ABC-type antimicrobial peptide transport system permease subunit
MAKIGCPIGSCFESTDLRPADISDYARIRQTPLVLALVLGFLGAGTLAYVLVTSIRRRRRDLAVLKTLGFVRRQISGAVAWQSSAIAAVALLLGLPIGIGLGRWVWALFANSVGVAGDPSVPLLVVLLIVPGALLLANVIAAGPGRSAAKIGAAAVLRSE